MRDRSNTILQRRVFHKGQMIFHQGEYGSNGYVIQSGQVEVFLTQQGQEVQLAVLGPGEVVGEMGVLFDDARSASVRALTDCDLVVMDREAIVKHIETAPPSVRAMIKILSERIRRTNRRVALNEDEDLPQPNESRASDGT